VCGGQPGEDPADVRRGHDANELSLIQYQSPVGGGGFEAEQQVGQGLVGSGGDDLAHREHDVTECRRRPVLRGDLAGAVEGDQPDRPGIAMLRRAVAVVGLSLVILGGA
jgi:hypothetical protein